MLGKLVLLLDGELPRSMIGTFSLQNVTSTSLLFTDLNILSQKLCSWSVGSLFYLNPKGTICTVSKKTRNTPCKGDSGSPLLCDVPDAEGDVLAPDLIEFWRKDGYSPNSGQRKVIGIVSWGLGCTVSEAGIPSMFTDISHYRSWMREVVYNSSSSLYCMRLILLLISAMHLQTHCNCQSILTFGKICTH
ncbi:hypothetical protein J437_LFUL010631 [Ladona fulva]|uniref:Peptidase S1 domain-containing protein n=1 Tax=Ladona fulva TaxID=123851 RepID=A0A8K0K7X7_LADFU|nr:hypothetical protein J437_LFUL010631 [Ladona fulva]